MKGDMKYPAGECYSCRRNLGNSIGRGDHRVKGRGRKGGWVWGGGGRHRERKKERESRGLERRLAGRNNSCPLVPLHHFLAGMHLLSSSLHPA